MRTTRRLAAYLAASAKVSQATALSEAQLKRLDAQLLAISNAFRPLASISSLAGAEVKKSGNEIEKTGEKSKHAKKEVDDLRVGFRGLGEGVSKTAEVLRDMLVAMPEVAAVVGVLAGVAEVVSKIREAFSYGDKLAALSRQTGESATTLAQLSRTFEYFQVSSDEVGHTLFMLQKALGGVSEAGEPTAEAFARLGLNIMDLRKMDAGQQFSAIMLGLQKLPDQATRSAVAMKIFGRSAMEVQAILNASPADFQASMQDAAEYAQVMGRNAAAFEDIERKFFVFREQIETIFARIAAGLVPAVQSLLDLVNKIDFSKWGQQITLVMGIITQAFSQGKVGELLGLTLKLGFIDAINTLNAGFYALAAGITGYFTTILPTNLQTAFAVLTNPKFWKGIGDLVLGSFLSIQSRLAQIFVDIGVMFESLLQFAVNKLANNPLLRALLAAVSPAAALGLSLAKPDARSLDQIEKDNATSAAPLYQGLGGNAGAGDRMTKQGVKDISGALEAPLANIAGALQLVISQMQVAYKNAPNAIDPTHAVNQLTALLASLVKIIPDEATKPAGASSGPSLPNFNYKLPEGDRLAKMGLFVGGSTASPGLTEARRTAAATERTAKGIERIINVSGGRPGQTAAIYI